MDVPPPSSRSPRFLTGHLRRVTLWVGVVVVFWVVMLLRAAPSFLRGTFLAEGGEWAEIGRDMNFWQLAKEARAPYGHDYWVLGNACVISASEQLAKALPVEYRPHVHTVVSCLYLALIYAGCWRVLRFFSLAAAWWGTLAMALVPELGGGGLAAMPGADLTELGRGMRVMGRSLVCFGESSNVGFFSAVVVVFVQLRLWLRPDVGRWELLWLMVVSVFHGLTSPLAVVLAGMGAAVNGLGALCKLRRVRMEVLVFHGLLLAASAWGWLQVSESSIDAGERQVLPAKAWVELIGARQLFYPLVFPFYRLLNDHVVMGLMGLFLGGVGWWGWRQWRQGATDVLGFLLLPLSAAAVSGATVFLRGWRLVTWDYAYHQTDPDRYFMAQNALMAGFMTVGLIIWSQRYPLRRSAVIAGFCLWHGAALMAGASRVQEFRAQELGITEARRRWPNTLQHEARLLQLGEGWAAGRVPILPSPWTMVVPPRVSGRVDEGARAAQVEAGALMTRKSGSTILSAPVEIVFRPAGVILRTAWECPSTTGKPMGKPPYVEGVPAGGMIAWSQDSALRPFSITESRMNFGLFDLCLPHPQSRQACTEAARGMRIGYGNQSKTLELLLQPSHEVPGYTWLPGDFNANPDLGTAGAWWTVPGVVTGLSCSQSEQGIIMREVLPSARRLLKLRLPEPVSLREVERLVLGLVGKKRLASLPQALHCRLVAASGLGVEMRLGCSDGYSLHKRVYGTCRIPREWFSSQAEMVETLEVDLTEWPEGGVIEILHAEVRGHESAGSPTP